MTIQVHDGSRETWPRLDVGGGPETRRSLLLWGQILGKTRLALCPMVNHWWQVPLMVTARGLTTTPMPIGDRVLDLELDFIDHRLVARTSDGGLESMALCEQTLAAFYREYQRRLASLGVSVPIYPVAVEVPDVIRLDQDERRCGYDPDWANRYFRALIQVDRLLKEFRGRFLGKGSPVHLFWGAFDLAVTRFSGRPAPEHPGGVPHVGDWVMREAYSQEVSSAGFWPGDDRFPQAAFYSYAYPAPAGFGEAPVRPAAARYEPALGEFLLPYADVRAAKDPSADVLAFLQSSYEAAADLGNWDRLRLERNEADAFIGGDRARRDAELTHGRS
ncbi:MAG TPA: DUF5996 family protein [Polyangia bacterium]|jgi:hypothetical protein|nr:DUF5996 family protein [Polyangia bacterium]